VSSDDNIVTTCVWWCLAKKLLNFSKCKYQKTIIKIYQQLFRFNYEWYPRFHNGSCVNAKINILIGQSNTLIEQSLNIVIRTFEYEDTCIIWTLLFLKLVYIANAS